MGRGIGSAAIRAILKVAFSGKDVVVDETSEIRDLALHKIWLMIFRENQRSHQTYLRLGFKDEGLLREEYFHQDRWHDMVRMSLLVDEWQEESK
ncbi:MAG: GNAT family N-acetyltransferase [Deltaproteobacteria bacterium]|nr:GNAT family N-acetyltransferase [Deltaproteobacteria bacterium]